jgi:hypothetical protein
MFKSSDDYQMDVFLNEGLLVHVFVRTGKLYASLHKYHYDLQDIDKMHSWKQLRWPVEEKRSWWHRLFWHKQDGPSLSVNRKDFSVVDRPLSVVLSDVKKILV